MAMNDNLPSVMTFDAFESPADCGGSGLVEATSALDATPAPFARQGEGEMITITRLIHVVPEKVVDEERDALAKDEAVTMDERRKVAASSADCKAKNRFRCPYHGQAAMNEAIREVFRKNGLGSLDPKIEAFDLDDEDDLSYKFTVTCPKFLEGKVLDSLKEFVKEGKSLRLDEFAEEDIKAVGADKTAFFSVDYLDKDADGPGEDAGDSPYGVKEDEYTKPPEGRAKEPSDGSPGPGEDGLKDRIARAIASLNEFSEMIPASSLSEVMEAWLKYTLCSKDVAFLEKAAEGAPNGRTKEILGERLDAAKKETDICLNDLRLVYRDAKWSLICAIGARLVSGRLEYGSKKALVTRSDVMKEIEALIKEAGLVTAARVDGYEEMIKAQKAFDEAESLLSSLSDEYDKATQWSDFHGMMDLADSYVEQTKKCTAAADNLKLARENVKASLVKMVYEARKSRYESIPGGLRQSSPLPGETIEQYAERLNKLGMKVPVSLDCRDYVESEAYEAYCKEVGVSASEMEEARRDAKTYEQVLKETDDNVRETAFADMDEASYKKMCAEFADVVNENMERCAYGCRVPAGRLSGEGRFGVLDAVIRGHLMNQLESRMSGGCLFSIGAGDNAKPSNIRAMYSHRCFGNAYHMPPDKYEKYGCIASADPGDDFGPNDPTRCASHYGDCIIRFRKDKTVATVSGGDSSWGWEKHGHNTLPLITDCKPTHVPALSAKVVVKRVRKGMTPRDFVQGMATEGPLCELQYHNENMGAEFIESISLPNGSALEKLSEKAKELILKHDIKVYVNGEPYDITA